MSLLEPAPGKSRLEPRLEDGGHREPARANKALIFVGGALLGSFLYACSGAIGALVRTWWNIAAYHHGFLIPPIACCLVWTHRREIQRAAAAPQYLTGSILCLSGFLLLFVGHASAFLTLEYIALPVTLLGAVLLLLGRQVLRIVGLPIGYLTLMLPVWDILMDRIRYPAQLISAKLGALILQAVGTPARRDGLQIVLPNVVVDVTPDCSGLNYLLAFIAVAIPLGILFVKGRLARFLLIAGSLVVAFSSNGLRIALVGLLASDSGDAPYHDISGLFVAVVGLVALFVGAMVFSRWRPASSPIETVTGGESGGAGGCSVSAFVRTSTFRRLGLSLSLGLTLAGVLVDFHREKAVPLAKDLSGFPLELGAWKARPGEARVAAGLALKADQSLNRIYERDSCPPIGLYLGYLEQQEQEEGRELIDHKTEALHRAAAPLTLELRAQEAFQADSVVLEAAGSRKLRLFWWELEGRSISNPYRVKLLDAYRSVIRGTSNGALVVVEIAAGPEEEVSSSTLGALTDFIQELLPAVKMCLRPGSPRSR